MFHEIVWKAFEKIFCKDFLQRFFVEAVTVIKYSQNHAEIFYFDNIEFTVFCQ